MTSDRWSAAQLLERAKHLRPLAAQHDGVAGEALKKYPRHATMLTFRSHSGEGEVHQHFADLFYVLDGHATLVTGGEPVEAKTTGPGETRSTAIKGGSSEEMNPGDVLHVPAGMPHQMLLAEGETVTYFVVKIQESE